MLQATGLEVGVRKFFSRMQALRVNRMLTTLPSGIGYGKSSQVSLLIYRGTNIRRLTSHRENIKKAFSEKGSGCQILIMSFLTGYVHRSSMSCGFANNCFRSYGLNLQNDCRNM